MTPEEAERFHEDDEDPAKVFAAFDAGSKGVTAPPDAGAQFRRARAYMQERYGTQAAALEHEAPADWYTAGGFLPPITTDDS